MKLNLKSLKDLKSWEDNGFELPKYSIEEVRARTRENPQWVHFGPGNIFRAFVARIHDELLDRGIVNTGIIVAKTTNPDTLDSVFSAYDNLSTSVTLKRDGNIDMRVVGCIAETVKANQNISNQWERMQAIFSEPSLQFASMTITEKGYNIQDLDGEFTPQVKSEMQDPKLESSNSMGLMCLLLYARYQAGKFPITMVSMDNVSHNGSLLRESILAYAKAWTEAGYIDRDFYDYVNDESVVSFTWSMIDKITPAPDPEIAEILRRKNYEDVGFSEINPKAKPSFANAEETEYLVIEDRFTNGRPAWEEGGVIFTDRETVDRAETMKVTTCLNPLHTALAIYGCLLGYDKINAEMQDQDLVNLIKGIGYREGLPVVVDPKILDPKEFIDEVINERFPNPFLPDTPQRIATDTSQKLSVRYGKTLQEYQKRYPDKIADLEFIPAVIAGWFRYMLAVDDQGKDMSLSPDPMLKTLQEALAEIEFGKDSSQTTDILTSILNNQELFGVDLVECGLADKIIANFYKLNQGPGAVRKFLQELPRVYVLE